MGVWNVYFILELRRKTHTHTHTHTHILYQLLFYNIPQKLFFILFLITSIE